MDQPFESEVMEDLAVDSSFDESFDAFEGMESEGFEGEDQLSDMMDEFAGEEFEEGFEDSFNDGFTEDLGEDYFHEEVDAYAFEDAIADALDAEDTEEFLRRVSRIARRAVGIARQVGRGVGQVARVVGPIASAIPLPQAQAIGRIASIAGRVLADGADEFELLDDLIDLADEEGAIDAAAPVIAGLTVRTVMPSATRLSRPVRRQVVRSVTQATRAIVRRQGAPAARAIPQVVRAVQRTATQRRMPARQLPQAIRRTAARVAASPQLTRRLAQTTRRQPRSRTRGRRLATAGGFPQRYSVSGPVEIIIRRR
jgi:hypothetical protein